MERYIIDTCKVEQVTKITVTLDLATDDKVGKEYVIYEGDNISFLYTENMEDVGKNDKIVRGKVVGIVQKPRFNIKQLTPGLKPVSHQNITQLNLTKRENANFDDIILVIDESVQYQTIINRYPLSKILDINPVDYVYPEDNPTGLDTSSGLSTFDTVYSEKIYDTKQDPNSSGNPYPILPSSYTQASSADYEDTGVTEAYSNMSQTGVANSQLGIAESELGVAESVKPIDVATSDMVVEKTEIGVATPEMCGGVLKL